MGNEAESGIAVRDALAKLDLGELAGQENRMLGENWIPTGRVLSGGQQQKLVVARLADRFLRDCASGEPSAALDPISSAAMLRTVLEAAGDRTVIMISHDMSFSKWCGPGFVF